MSSDALIMAASASAACGSAALRFAWSRPRRSMAWNGVGWGLFALAAVLGAFGAGAWGIAVASMWGMAAALLLLTHAALMSPADKAAKASNRRVNMLPQGNEPLHLVRRIVTFLIVALTAMIVSIGLALAARSLVFLSGAGEANANVMAYYAQPIAWGLLAYALLMMECRASQWKLLLACAVPGAIALAAGMAS